MSRETATSSFLMLLWPAMAVGLQPGQVCAQCDPISLQVVTHPTQNLMGFSVAMDGNIMAVANSPLAPGGVRIYYFDGALWSLETTLQPGNLTNADLELSGDVLAIGGAGANNLGVPVYERDINGNWSLLDSLTAADTSSTFGYHVGSDGDVIAVADLITPARVFVYRRTGDSWSLEQTLPNPAAGESNGFGYGTSVSGDTILVGAPASNNGCPPQEECYTGLVYVYQYDGSSWSLGPTLTAPVPEESAGFGTATAIDGDVAVIGAT